MLYVQFHMLNTHSKKIVFVLDYTTQLPELHAAFISCFQVVSIFVDPASYSQMTFY